MVEVSNNVEIKIAPGMITDLHVNPEIERKRSKSSTSSDENSQKKGFLSGIFNKKK